MYLSEGVRKVAGGREAIHSGHFMVSHFEAEAQDDDDTAVPIPDISIKDAQRAVIVDVTMDHFVNDKRLQPIAIENGLSTLFQCMSIAYRQKLTSPKWNRFRGIRLRWKDKIRLNNVIWRCWHMQFMKKQNTPICQFASPLDVDTHNKPEAIVLEGKYWKRKLEAVTAEYKKWRMFYKTQSLGHHKDANDLFLEMELLKYHFPEDVNMLMDEDYMGLMSDTLFSTISNQPFAFPDTRDIAKAGLSHFIQPSLGPLQPNLPNNEFMDFEHVDTLMNKLPTVPEEPLCNKSLGWGYTDLDLNTNNLNIPTPNPMDSYQTPLQVSMTLEPAQLQTGRSSSSSSYPADVIMQSSPPPYKQSKQKESSKKSYEPVPDYHMSGLSAAMQLPQATSRQQQQQQQQQQVAGFGGTPPKYHHGPELSYKVGGRSSAAGPMGASGSQASGKLSQLVKEDKSVNGIRERSIQRARRSRSNSRETLKRPPLQSAVSDPSLITPANNMILSQLLTTNSEALYRNSQVSPPIREAVGAVRCKEEPLQRQQICLLNSSPAVIIAPSGGNANGTATAPSAIEVKTLRGQLSSPLNIVETSLGSPTSPHGSVESLNREPTQHREQKRAGHIHAEQKRRYNIKNGFDALHSLIPHLNQNPNAKLSKAAMLQKGADYIVQLKNEREQIKEEMDSLKQQIDSLTTSICNCQCLLPATGAPISTRKRDLKMQEMFDEYVRVRTLENWKFWIFSLLIKPLLSSFNSFVSTSSLDDLYKSTFHWVDQHCALGDLRPVVFNSLKHLCTKTEILLMPEKLPEEARSQVMPPTQGSSSQSNL